MAQNYQNVTISLTLPISCQICLGKVRQPVVCCNHHVFCSVCMDVWLSVASQCPTCRVPITPDNPCREIIGATNESDVPESPTMKRRLRKSRGELLLKEYEDEIESLERENEQLRNKNRAAETQLETILEPRAVSVSHDEDRGLDPTELEEWAGKLRAATDLYEKVKQDVEKLREANKTLRAQNVDLVQENMRLKAEVESRSPQKYGRYTVAALEAKVQQLERDVAHLKRALERSDHFIEELEAQRDQVADPSTDAPGPREDPRSECTHTGESEAGRRPHGDRITAMRRSLSEMEETSVHTDLGGATSAFGGNQGLLLTTSERLLRDTASPHKVGGDVGGCVDGCLSSAGFVSPSTPSSALRSLSLRSPLVQSEGRAGRGCDQGRGPLSYLRRLSFDGCGPSVAPTASEQKPAASKNNLREAPWMTKQSFRGANGTVESPNVTHNVTDTLGASSEACMDAAYQDKMSELDSLISDDEGPSGTGSRLTVSTAGHSSGQLTTGTECELGILDQTDTTGRDATLRLGADAQESGQRLLERAEVIPMTSVEIRSSLPSSEMAAEVVQVTKRRCPSGPLTSSPSKLSKHN
ncbi:ORC ubiquitin ligase 1 [Clupea harengus]|uniref:ORC ubiquitin ligase 1 n=1 Tax=Clupea harengus TaxID=7950 RepID=A0A6P3WE76_CLUHA|nr:ORC ubiquitin ligase 1 [Clupea harengus]